LTGSLNFGIEISLYHPATEENETEWKTFYNNV
jgi:hypothetical protein